MIAVLENCAQAVGAGRQRVSAPSRVSGLTGLATKSSMPAATHRSFSSGVTPAVIAMTGVRRPLASLLPQLGSVAW